MRASGNHRLLFENEAKEEQEERRGKWKVEEKRE